MLALVCDCGKAGCRPLAASILPFVSEEREQPEDAAQRHGPGLTQFALARWLRSLWVQLSPFQTSSWTWLSWLV